MSPVFPLSTLLPQQTRMINASEGFRLDVLEGCLWLTRPGDESDRFLHAGSSIVLTQDQVLIQCDRRFAQSTPLAACYRLVPLSLLASAATPRRSRSFQWPRGLRWLQPLRA
ncbi:DUF2917 domain-containing protein [Curvibacter sp. APW13]|uniref:DUF2917 domain-containing protein n=1 Tax=Curvibacter sp. APW13 TaxID=3077236 RepID=UPI0028DE377F|nr:DUF2917 domain-containing protein [Curvibacter sp. APW13]MDT8989973.1 DUF2917 domain-containing protein [Curvibacter sp. APW13]